MRIIRAAVIPAGLVALASGAFAQPAPVSLETRTAIIERDAQQLWQDVLGLRQALQAAEATVAAQRAKLDWWARYAGGMGKKR